VIVLARLQSVEVGDAVGSHGRTRQSRGPEVGVGPLLSTGTGGVGQYQTVTCFLAQQPKLLASERKTVVWINGTRHPAILPPWAPERDWRAVLGNTQ
jgi:hypothetical protein